MQKYAQKSPVTDCSSHVYECGRGPSGASYATKSCAGPSYTSGSAVPGANTRHAAPECDPLHGRRCRRHLEGGNGHVWIDTEGILWWVGPQTLF